MGRLKFNSKGRIESVDSNLGEYFVKGEEETQSGEKLKTSSDLEFLRETQERELKIFDAPFWSLYAGDKKLEPLIFSNGKNQEDIVKEIVGLIKEGTKVVLLKGVCGTGKSVIALNIARALGRASIVVPVKGLQRQYEEDYAGKKYLLGKNGRKLKIAMITGRENHDSIFNPGVSCADQFLPDTIKITEKNYNQIMEYYEQNPFIRSKADLDISEIKRISIAPTNPYWSPILPADYEVPLKDAKKKKYRGLQGKDFIFYHRKSGCSYFDQYQAYIDADILIFNSAKYKIEVALNRKPETDVEIIDEADEFLDSFSSEEEINLTRLSNALKMIKPENEKAKTFIKELLELIALEEKNKQALGISEEQIFHLNDTKIQKMLSIVLNNPEVEAEISLDEINYGNRLIETAEEFSSFFDDTYLTYRKDENGLYANLVTTNLSKKFKEIIDKNKSLVLMSGTLHSDRVMKEIYGVENFRVVDAETSLPGIVEIEKTGKEFDCKYENLKKKEARKQYLLALQDCVKKAKKPLLVHVNAFEDLPSELELKEYVLSGLMSREKLRELQENDKTGRMVSMFKSKMMDCLFTTKCSRGVDFPGDVCNSIVFTKYPNPNVRGTFWKILKETHPYHYWDFYRDKARREFLQRIYRAVRFKDDKVSILSPDSRVLDAVRGLQTTAGASE